jgi:hypothetical protein
MELLQAWETISKVNWCIRSMEKNKAFSDSVFMSASKNPITSLAATPKKRILTNSEISQN